MSPTAHQAMAALEQAWLTWMKQTGNPDLLTPTERALRDALTAWIAGGRR